MSVNEERSALDMDTVNLECHAQQHSILNNIENIFFFFSDLSGKELDLACLFVFLFCFVFVFLVKWIKVQFLYFSILNTKFDFLTLVSQL